MNSEVQVVNNLWRWLSGQRDPIGYQPGRVLHLVEKNLQPFECKRLSDRVLHVVCPQGLEVEVEERVVTSFRSYSITCHFHLRGETGLQQPIHIQAKNTDILGRGDTRFSAKTSNDDSRRLMAVLDCYPEITDALDCLNFRRLNLRSEAGQWQLEIELFAATELVGPRPVCSDYQRLPYAQRHLMLDVMQMFQKLMDRVTVQGVAA